MFAIKPCMVYVSLTEFKKASAYVCHLHKGNNKYVDTRTRAQADLSLGLRIGRWGQFQIVGNYVRVFTSSIRITSYLF